MQSYSTLPILQMFMCILQCTVNWNYKKAYCSFLAGRKKNRVKHKEIITISLPFLLSKKMLETEINLSWFAFTSQVMDLKGQMIYIVESSAILFLGSPCVDRLEDFTGRGLYLSDIPIHNALRDVVLIGEQARAQDGLKKRLGKLKATLEQAHQALEEEKKKTVDLLCSIFPSEVAQQLWQGQVVQAKKFSDVTMLFSDIVGFTAICSQCSPLQVITMLNALYTRFDQQCGELDVYKVGAEEVKAHGTGRSH